MACCVADVAQALLPDLLRGATEQECGGHNLYSDLFLSHSQVKLVPSPPGAHRAADGAVADEGGHRGGPGHAPGLAGLADGSTLPRAAAHPQLPGAHSSQRPRPAQRQRRPGADVEAPQRNAARGHTAKIG